MSTRGQSGRGKMLFEEDGKRTNCCENCLPTLSSVNAAPPPVVVCQRKDNEQKGFRFVCSSNQLVVLLPRGTDSDLERSRFFKAVITFKS